MTSARIALAVLAAAALAQPAAAAPASLFGRNLLVNGDAEAPYDEAAKVPGWTHVEGFEVDRYGGVGGEWDYGLSGCPDCKAQYLRLGFQADVRELSTSQAIDVAPAAGEIDAGKVRVRISAWLGGFHDADTSGEVLAIFDDAAGHELGRIATKPYDTAALPKAERGDAGLVACEATGPVPAGARKIVYVWKGEATGRSGDYAALGDDFALVLTAAGG